MTLIVHHLNNSRSQRILWLLEELNLPYEIRHHQRDAVTNLAPPELLAIHPLGKSPVIEDDGKVIYEISRHRRIYLRTARWRASGSGTRHR